jgi:prepilin-type N-terminal cleavage/methylation domain-containing protein
MARRTLIGSVSRPRGQGFSLIEMLVAMVIMGLALSVLYQSASGATRNIRVSAEYSQALALAESTMEAFSALLFIGKQETGQYGSYEWSARAEPLGSMANYSIEQRGDSQDALTYVTVSVTWANEANRREIVLQSVGEITEVTDES